MVRDKISNAINESKELLDKSLEALISKNLVEFERNLWLTSSNMEYAAFLLSLMMVEKPNLNLDTSTHAKDDVDTLLGHSFDMLNEASKYVVDDKFIEAYKSIKKARVALIKIFKIMEKKSASRRALHRS